MLIEFQPDLPQCPRLVSNVTAVLLQGDGRGSDGLVLTLQRPIEADVVGTRVQEVLRLTTLSRAI